MGAQLVHGQLVLPAVQLTKLAASAMYSNLIRPMGIGIAAGATAVVSAARDAAHFAGNGLKAAAESVKAASKAMYHSVRAAAGRHRRGHTSPKQTSTSCTAPSQHASQLPAHTRAAQTCSMPVAVLYPQHCKTSCDLHDAQKHYAA